MVQLRMSHLAISDDRDGVFKDVNAKLFLSESRGTELCWRDYHDNRILNFCYL